MDDDPRARWMTAVAHIPTRFKKTGTPDQIVFVNVNPRVQTAEKCIIYSSFSQLEIVVWQLYLNPSTTFKAIKNIQYAYLSNF